jgi:hypothetical protein
MHLLFLTYGSVAQRKRQWTQMGRLLGNEWVVRCKFGERLTDNADANAERNC